MSGTKIRQTCQSLVRPCGICADLKSAICADWQCNCYVQSTPGAKPLHVALAQNKTDRQRKARQASRARTMNGDASSDRVSIRP